MRQIIKKFLAFSERYTKTDMTYLAKGGFWISISYSIQIISGLILTVALANLLPKNVLGTYQYILALAGILSVLTLSGASKAIVSAVARGDDGAFLSSVRTVLKWNIIILLSSLSVSCYYYLNGNTELGTAFLIVAFFAPLIEAFKLYQSYLQGKEAFKDGVTLGAWRKPLPLIAMIIGLYFTDNVVYLIFVYFFTNAVSNIWVYFLVIRKYHPPIKAKEDVLSYSKHLSILVIIGKLASHADKLILWQFIGPVAVASFTIAQLATKYSGGALNALATIVLPKLSRRDLATLQQTLPRKVFFFTLAMSVGAIIYILVIPFIFDIIFPQYKESILIAQLLAVSLVFLPRSIYTKALIAHQQVRYQYYLMLVLSIIAMLVLIPIFGILGAAYATIISELVSAIVSYSLFKRAKSV